MVAHRVAIWGHKFSRHLGLYLRINEHHLLAHRTDLCVEYEVMEVSIVKNLFSTVFGHFCLQMSSYIGP
jgi:hypothetical protein